MVFILCTDSRFPLVSFSVYLKDFLQHFQRDLWVMESFSLVCWEKALFCHCFWKIFLLGIEMQVEFLSLSILKLLLQCLLACTVSDKTFSSIFIFLPPFISALSPQGYFWNVFSLSQFLSTLIVMCFGMFFFKFLLLRVHWAPWMCGLMVIFKFGKYSTIIYSDILRSPSLPQQHTHTLLERDVNYMQLSPSSVMLCSCCFSLLKKSVFHFG